MHRSGFKTLDHACGQGFDRCDQRRHRNRGQTLTQRLQLPVAKVTRRGDWRVAGNREDGIAVRAVIVKAAAGA